MGKATSRVHLLHVREFSAHYYLALYEKYFTVWPIISFLQDVIPYMYCENQKRHIQNANLS